MAFEGLDTGEVALLAEGLHRLREIKVQALEEIVKVLGHESSFTPRDFGIPMIDALLEKLDVAQANL
jgi:hypothetical protein